MNKITIDFNDHIDKPIKIFEKKYVREEKRILGIFGMRPPGFEVHRISLEFIDGPEYIKDEFNNLFRLRISELEVLGLLPEFMKLPIPSNELKVEVLILPKKIDIPQDQIQESVLNIRVKLDIIFQLEKDGDVGTENLDIELIVLKEKGKHNFYLTKHEDFNKDIVYERKKFNFGRFIISNVASQIFSFPVHVKDLKFKITDKDNNVYKDVIRVETSNDDNYINDTREKGVTCNDPEPLELTIDMGMITPPKSLGSYNVSVEGKVKIDNSKWVGIESVLDDASFDIRENDQKTELFVEYKDGGGDVVSPINNPFDNKTITLLEKTYELSYEGSTTIIEGKIGNRATVKSNDRVEKSISVRNIEINPGLESAILDKSGKVLDIKKYIKFSIKTPKSDSYIEIVEDNMEYDLPNENDSFIQFRVDVKDADFDCLPSNEENYMIILIPISYEYAIKIEGDELDSSSYKKCTHSFQFALRQYQGRNWLALDFGTSAIVAIYSDGVSEEYQLLDLQKKHENIIGDRYTKENIEEFNTPFLSSTVLLKEDTIKHLDHKLSKKENLKNTVQISPLIDTFKISSNFLSPYLKSLIGYTKLPEIFQNRINRDTDFDIGVNRIIEGTYAKLLSDYIIPIVSDNRNFESNKIVLSVPNAFTSRHKNILDDLIRSSVPSIWERYVCFVSESDVVASHYVFNYTSLIENHTLKGKQKQNIHHREEYGDTVLVYDMGAGTLDLTLFSWQPIENNCFELKILGKTGFTTAGNYLDTLLAEIVYEQELTPKNDFHPIDNFTNYFSEVLIYKLFIKNILKPALKDSNIHSNKTINLPDESSKLEASQIQLDKVKESELFKNYKRKVTDQAIDFLKNNLSIDSENIKIKTLIITGRAAQLDGLETRLIESIKNTFGIVEEYFLSIVPEEQEMKSVVAKGAIDYICNIFESRNKYKSLPIHARIGYMIVKHTGLQYEEIISPKHNKKLSRKHMFTDISRPGYLFEKKINLNNVKRIMVIQTYYYDKEKLKEEYRKQKHGDFFDASNILFQFHRGRGENGFHPQEDMGTLSVLICEDGEVAARITTSRSSGKSPSSKNTSTIDIQNSRSFERSMWPILQPSK
jgi:hypothetical protein